MRTPRDVTGSDLVKALKVLGYERVRQEDSHIRLSTQQGGDFMLRCRITPDETGDIQEHHQADRRASRDDPGGTYW
ncbi:MAG: type II toxin-antitoxin system HicA family toxin [Chthoniobacterales bacterium]|nr:type II toxin-antitoxin system HicA family toxin [Chthoniobacterales bacterium]